jgi:hypothetical protein
MRFPDLNFKGMYTNDLVRDSATYLANMSSVADFLKNQTAFKTRKRSGS